MTTNSRGPDVILIGPVGAGKTTIGEMLAVQLDLPSICLDEIAEKYYEECGMGHACPRQRKTPEGGRAKPPR